MCLAAITWDLLQRRFPYYLHCEYMLGSRIVSESLRESQDLWGPFVQGVPNQHIRCGIGVGRVSGL